MASLGWKGLSNILTFPEVWCKSNFASVGILYTQGHQYIYICLIYLLTAIGLTPGGSSTVHIYTQTVRKTAQLTTLVGSLSGIRTQSGQT
jgi:uncharacterized integral membrane protein